MLKRNFFIALGLALLLNAPVYVQADPPGKNMTSPASPAASQAKQEEPAPKSPTDYTPAERQAYQNKMARDFENLRQRVEDLKLKTLQIPPQKKRMALRALVDLQRRLNYAKQKLTALKSAPGTTWSSFKDRADKSMANLTLAVEALEGHI
jgi:hypothetical protein